MIDGYALVHNVVYSTCLGSGYFLGGHLGFAQAPKKNMEATKFTTLKNDILFGNDPS